MKSLLLLQGDSTLRTLKTAEITSASHSIPLQPHHILRIAVLWNFQAIDFSKISKISLVWHLKTA
jgi:hypothetical protein